MKTTFALWLLCAVAATASAASEIVAYNAVAFKKVNSVSVAKLDGSQRLVFRRFLKRSFHHYRLLSEWKRPDPFTSQAIAKILMQQIDERIAIYASAGDHEVIEISSFCIPRPGFAVKLETDHGSRDFLICIEC